MKNLICAILCLALISGLTACGKNDQPPSDENVAVSDTGSIDIDLTSLSSTMVYSEVYNMIADPDAYIGKTVKMSGTYTVYYEENSGNRYFACIIQDAAACCSQGIEFTLTDNYSYPDDYPEEGDTIIVTGVFSTYKEGEYTYCTLKNASLDAMSNQYTVGFSVHTPFDVKPYGHNDNRNKGLRLQG